MKYDAKIAYSTERVWEVILIQGLVTRIKNMIAGRLLDDSYTLVLVFTYITVRVLWLECRKNWFPTFTASNSYIYWSQYCFKISNFTVLNIHTELRGPIA